MATTAEKITALTELTTPVGADLLCIVDDVAGTATTKKMTLTNLFGVVPVNIVQNNALNIQTDKVRARDGDGLYLVDDGDNGLFIEDGGIAYLGAYVTNAKMTLGLTIQQGANDDEILALKSSDVAHPVTALTETDTYGFFMKSEPTSGGLRIEGLKDSDGVAGYALYLIGTLGEAADTTKSTAGIGVVELQASITDGGTGRTTVGANGNLVAINNYGTAIAIFDAEGELHLDATLTENAWDEYDDMELLTALRASVMSPKAALYQRTKHLIEKHRDLLEETGVITYNEDGHHFIAMKAFTFLLTDAIRQVGARLQVHEQALLELGVQPQLLEV